MLDAMKVALVPRCGQESEDGDKAAEETWALQPQRCCATSPSIQLVYTYSP